MKAQPNAGTPQSQPETQTKTLEQRLETELAALAAQSQRRELAVLPAMNFCSNDYLGLSNDPRLRAAISDALAAGCAVGSTGSRLLSGHAEIWDQLEDDLARFAGTPAALYFNSGYAANLGLFTSLAGPEDVIFSDASNHASIIDGIRLSGAQKVIFPHLDLAFLEGALRQSRTARHKFIAVESVFSMEGDLAPLAELSWLARRWGAELIVDEAHATGVFGRQGRGLAAGNADTLAVVHTCGKAWAAVGAFACCSETVKQTLINRARTFIFSTALPPYVAAQMRAAIRIVAAADAERARLAELSAHLRARLRSVGFDLGSNGGRSESQIIPVMLGENQRALEVAAHLGKAGFAVRAIRPPTVPRGTARLRLSLHAAMPIALLDSLADALIRIRESIPTFSLAVNR